MDKNLNDIIESINTKLSDENRTQNLQNAIQKQNNVKTNNFEIENSVFKPSHNMIISEIYVIAPTQLKLISDMLSKKIANSMNMRALNPKIKDIIDMTLPEILSSMKKSGK